MDLSTIKTPRIFVGSLTKDRYLKPFFSSFAITLLRSKLSVSTAVVGSSLVRSNFLRRLTARYSYLLDTLVLNSLNMSETFARACAGAEVILVQGSSDGVLSSKEEGLYKKNNLFLASRFRMSMVLLVDSSLGSDYICDGVKEIASEIKHLFIIASNCNSQQDYQKVKNICSENDLELLGYIQAQHNNTFAEEFLKENPNLFPRTLLVKQVDFFSNHIDTQKLLDTLNKSVPIDIPKYALSSKSVSSRIAVADDLVFQLTVQDNLSLLKREGAYLCPFSPMADYKLPKDVQALYIPSGFFRKYMEELENNKPMIEAIRDFYKKGKFIYCEGDSVAYMSEKVIDLEGKEHEMIGVLPAVTKLSSSLVQVRSNTTDVSILNAPYGIETGSSFRSGAISGTEVLLNKEVKMAFKLNGSINDGYMPNQNTLITSLTPHWNVMGDMAKSFMSLLNKRPIV